MHDILDLDQYPLHAPQSRAYQDLVARCKEDLAREGMCNLHRLLRPEVAAKVAADISPRMATQSIAHARRHNIYFQKSVAGLAPDHPALQTFETSNFTLCADQVADTPLAALYDWAPLGVFLAQVMGKRALHVMDDPLARLNVMAYGAGQALNWHFDRAEFTTTLLLQAPDAGGAFEYRTDLRTDDEPNYDGVTALLENRDPLKQSMSLKAGTLNVFRGITTPHRVTPVEGATQRIIAVFSYYDRAGVRFSDEERLGFYGRTG
ncbi:MAG: 2OG-Fe(II) oxygenase [Pseudomonadota bacterium]